MSDKPYIGNVLNNPKYKNKKDESAEIAGTLNTALEAAAHNDRIARFHGRQGHGYAAEQANDLIDRLHGKDATILGDDNAKNGPDRMSGGKPIQTKYCQNALASVNAAFENGVYRYIDANGEPMQLEVPKGQYEKAVDIMRKRITEGKVPNVNNPEQAKNLVREGNIDYQTAKNIAKACNIDSLKFDAAHGAVVAASTMGITSLITFAKAVWNGESTDKAIDIAMYTGVRMGGTAFITTVLASQLTKTSINNLLLEPSIHLVRMLPSSVRHALVNSMKDGALIYGGAATNNLAKLLRCNIITAAVVTLVMSKDDINNMFNGRISGKQLFKNVTSLIGGLGAGYGGAALGGVIAGPPGAVVGGVITGTIGGTATNRILNNFIEDDAVEMLRIINERLIPLTESYLLSEDELEIVIDDLKMELEKEKLLQMFASEDRGKFADELITELIEKTVRGRAHIYLPPIDDLRIGMNRVLELCSDTGALENYFAKIKVDADEMAKKLLGREVSERAARKALYATKQMNSTNVQGELLLHKMKVDDKRYRTRNEELNKNIADLKNEIDKMLDET